MKPYYTNANHTDGGKQSAGLKTPQNIFKHISLHSDKEQSNIYRKLSNSVDCFLIIIQLLAHHLKYNCICFIIALHI